jgi:hypothetical protein
MPPQRDPPRGGAGPKVRELRLPPYGPTHSCWWHGDPCPQGHRSLRGASLRIAVPGSYCHTLSVGDQTSETRCCTVGSFINCTHHRILLGSSNQGEWGRKGMWHAWERGEKCTGFWWKSPKEKDHLKDEGVDRIGSKWTLGRLAAGGGGVDSPGSG